MTDTSSRPARVAIVMGSSSDWPTMSRAAEVLERLDVPHDCRVLSAHRMPDEMFAFADGARDAGYRAIIAGAGHGFCPDAFRASCSERFYLHLGILVRGGYPRVAEHGHWRVGSFSRPNTSRISASFALKSL